MTEFLSETLAINVSQATAIEVEILDAALLDVNVPLFYIKSGKKEIQDYVDNVSKPEIDQYIVGQAEPIVTKLAEEKTGVLVDTYVESVAKPAIDEYVAAGIKPELQAYTDAAANSASLAEVEAVAAQGFSGAAQTSAAVAAQHADKAEGHMETAAGRADEAEASAQAAASTASSFDAHAVVLQEQFDANVSNKTSIYDANATNQTAIFNSNATEKQEQVDASAAEAATSAIEAKRFRDEAESVLAVHAGNTNNPHGVTKAQVGLDQADNTADADKPVSTAIQAALTAVQAQVDGKATPEAIVNYQPEVITLTQTSGTIVLTVNKIYSLAITGATTFALPTPSDTNVFNQIKVMLKVTGTPTVAWGTTQFFNKTTPEIAAGNYDVYFDFDKNMNAWAVGAMPKGAAS